MTLNGSGVRHCSGIACPATVIQVLKKIVHLEPVNQKLLQQLKPEEVEVEIVGAEVNQELEEAVI